MSESDTLPLRGDELGQRDNGCCRSVNKESVRRFLRNHWLLIATALGALVGLGVGALVGHFNPSSTAVRLIKLPGTLFIRALKAIVLPLIITSVSVGVASLYRAGGGRALVWRTMLYYAVTTMLAVVLGLTLVYVIAPGRSATPLPSPIVQNNSTIDALDTALAIVYAMVPENLVEAAVKMDVLGLIVASIVFSAIAAGAGRKGKLLLDLFAGVNRIVMRLVHYLMFATPVGVLSLLAGRLAESGSTFWSVLATLALYMATVIAGLLAHGVITLPLFYVVFVRKNPFRYMAGVAQSLLTAFGTASSSATVAVSTRVVETWGISSTVARFVLPLGATVNMDGTALYEAVAALFIAQSYGIELGIGSAVAVALTAVLASVGAAGIPEAGLVTMLMVLKAADLPAEGIALLLPVDWLLDRVRTAVNVWGDLVGAAIVDKYVPAGAATTAADSDSDQEHAERGQDARAEAGDEQKSQETVALTAV